MNVVWALNEPPESYTKSIFLAGPSPRQQDQSNWRADALSILDRMGYDGVVYVPLPESGIWTRDYESQVTWEVKNLNRADQIVFWVPRSESLPGLTTNVEYGRYFDSGRAVLGFPDTATSMRYLAHIGQISGVPQYGSLEETLAEAVRRCGSGSLRSGGERDIPLNIWNLQHFQSWYWAQTSAGNRLDAAEVLFTFRVGPQKGFVFAFILHVNVHIASEGRNKINEFIFARPDIATVVGYQKPSVSHNDFRSFAEDTVYRNSAARLLDFEIAIIREFRSPARTTDGFIREVPGGSSWKPGTDPFVTMTHELEEETGLGESSGFTLDPARLRRVGSRQLCGTLSVHQAHVFAVELTEKEMAFLRSQQDDNVVHGVEADTERTYVEVHRLGDLLASNSNLLDWSVLGQILTALVQPHAP